MLGQCRNRGGCNASRSEQRIAVATLECGFYTAADTCVLKRNPRSGWRKIVQTLAKAERMGAAADAFAMGVEECEGNVLEVMLFQQVQRPHPQALNQIRGG